MEKFLNLNQNQCIQIVKEKYYVTSMIKYIEGSSYWIEYKLINKENNKEYFLAVEPIGIISLHEIIHEDVQLAMEVRYNNELYELFQKGNAKIGGYFGNTDVALKESVEYYEYKNLQDKQKFLTIEKWNLISEVSLGILLSNDYVEIIDESEY